MRRYYAASALSHDAILQAAEAIRLSQASLEQQRAIVERFQEVSVRLQEASREDAEALARQDEAVQALLAFVPLTQAEIVRLDSRIDAVEGA